MGLQEYLSGKFGEDRAVKFLKKQGFEILDRNFHSKFGEIDIIATKNNILHFIEVKSTQSDYETAYRLTQSKFEKLVKTINFYLLNKGLNSDFQLDLLCVEKKGIYLKENISF